jgi:hypothetical protein
LTLAGVAGSGGAFAGAAASSNDAPAVAQSPAVVQASQFAQAVQAQSRTVTYQVGAAGTVTLTVANGVLTVVGAAPGTGWTVAPTITLGTHVEVQYTDTMQLVTFGADLVNNEVAVVLTNVAAPGALAPADLTPIDVSVVQPTTGRAVSQPRAATPQPAVAQPTATQQAPKPAATTAPSGSGDDHEEPGDD